MSKLRIILIILISTFSPIICLAESPIRHYVHPQIPPDSADVEHYGKKKFLQGAATILGINTAVWSYDRFVRNTDYSHISFKTIGNNIKEGFKWDNDELGTNMFMHPYHGNLYFNAGRSNGFNYWQSGLFALSGSALWELCMENEYPSTNDIIATPIGGMAIGEVAYRTSDLFIDDRSSGWERFGREAALFIVSPIRGITRIINGDAWRHRTTPGRQFGIPNIAVELSLGTNIIGIKHKVFDYGVGGTGELNIEYGDVYQLKSKKPYDYFKFRVRLNVEKTQPLLSQLNIMGRLMSRDLVDTKNDDLSLGLYQHFDFFNSDTISTESNIIPYKLGIPASVGAGLIYRCIGRGNFQANAFTHVNAIVLGGILSDHYDVKDRDYNLASGFSVKSGASIVFGDDKLALKATYDYYRLFTWGYKTGTDLSKANPRTINTEGDASVAFLGIAKIRADYRLTKHLYASASFMTYMRTTRYRDYPDVNSYTFSTRLMMTYKF